MLSFGNEVYATSQMSPKKYKDVIGEKNNFVFLERDLKMQSTFIFYIYFTYFKQIKVKILKLHVLSQLIYKIIEYKILTRKV